MPIGVQPDYENFIYKLMWLQVLVKRNDFHLCLSVGYSSENMIDYITGE